MNKRQHKKQHLKALTNVAINASIEAVEEGKLNKPLTRKQAELFARRYIAAKKRRSGRSLLYAQKREYQSLKRC